MLRIFLSAAAGCALAWLLSSAACLHAADALPALATDEEAKAREQVTEALRAEARGDNAARARGLASAWLAAPDLAEANWHLGRVQVNGEWLKLADAELAAGCDPILEEYRELRDAADNSRKLLALARWCTKHSLDDSARLHYAQLLSRKDTDERARQEAIKRLDLHNVGGQWITGEELAARQAEAKAIEAALEKWRPKLKTLQLAIDGSDYKLRDKAIAELHQMDDPEIIPVLESFLIDGGDRFQEEAVKRLAKFPHYEATEALVKYAVLSDFALTRDAAQQSLKKRPMHEYVPILLAGLTAPIKSRFQVSITDQGRITHSHAFLREGPTGNVCLLAQDVAFHRHIFSLTTSGKITRVPSWKQADLSGWDFTYRTSPQEAAQTKLRETQLRAANVESRLRLTNSQIDVANRRAFETLEATTEQQLSRDAVHWWNWWQGHNEYDWPRQTRFLRQSSVSTYFSYQWTHIHREGKGGPPTPLGRSCFVAGTPIQTQAGTAPIEALRPGDRVLSQDQDTGELAYKVVLRTTVRPPAKLILIQAGSEEIKATLGHPFWVSGHGWKMAKELEPGELLHTLGGAVPVERVDRLAVEKEAYNLVVDGFNTYFIGQQGLLVHDNEFRKPTRAIVPGLAAD